MPPKTSAGRSSGLLITIVKLVAILGAVDWLVAGPFFQGYVMKRYVAPFAILRELTGGQNPAIMLRAMRIAEKHKVQIAMVGDSTMNAADGIETTQLAFLVRENLRARWTRNDIEPVDASKIGLYASDAMLFIDKLLDAGADVIVYGAELRAFPKEPDQRFVSALNRMLSPSDLRRIFSVGGGRWLASNISGSDLVDGIVTTSWATYAYRLQLRAAVWDTVAGGVLPIELQSVFKPFPPQLQLQQSPRLVRRGPYDWSRSEYAMPNRNWDSLELVGRLCRRYAPGRCVLYAGPVNPLGRAQLVDPTLYEEYLARLRIIAGRYGLIWRDFTDAMIPADFRVPKYGGLRDPIHLNEGGRAKLAGMLVEPVSEALHAFIDRSGEAHSLRASHAHGQG